MAHEMFRLESKEMVRCHSIESEIWSNISQLESEFFVRNFLEKKISLLERKKSDFETIHEHKRKITEKTIRQNIVFLKLLNKADIDDNLISKITNTCRQSREFYFASRNLPLLSKPILLMYTFEKLAELLILTIFNTNFNTKYTHGVKLDKSDPQLVRPLPNGLFGIFHDCYSFFPQIYLSDFQFTLHDLLYFESPYDRTEKHALTKYIDMFRFLQDDHANYRLLVKENNSKKRSYMHELDREFLFIYIISTLSRYRVNQWSEMMKARESDIILKVQEYINTIELIFPNLVLNYIFDKKFLFVPFSYFEEKDAERIFDEKMRDTFGNLY